MGILHDDNPYAARSSSKKRAILFVVTVLTLDSLLVLGIMWWVS